MIEAHPYRYLLLTLFLSTVVLAGCSRFINSPSVQISNASGITFSTSTIVENTPNYTINVSYPVFALPDQTKESKLNATFLSTLTDAMTNFKRDVTPPESNDEKNNLTITFTPLLLINHLVSVYLNQFSYFSGTAHGNNVPIPFNYDLNRESTIGLKNIFKLPENKYLTFLSKISRELLQKQVTELDPDMLQNGTEPKTGNFSVFGIATDGIFIYFAPYQVAPYVAGLQTIFIPLVRLTPYLTADGPLRSLTN